MLKNIKAKFPVQLFTLRSGMYSVFDQGLYALGNFVVNIVLARLLEPIEYGVFAVAYSLFLFFAAFHSAILTEPMMVFGSGKYANSLRRYLKHLFHGHWILSGMIGIISGSVGVVMIFFDAQSLGYSFLTLAACSPFMLLIWFVRRIFYVLKWPKMAFIGSAFYLLFTLGSILFCIYYDFISVNITFAVFGVGSLFASTGLLYVLHYHVKESGMAPTSKAILLDHWKFGSWNSLAAGVFWMSGGMVTMLAAGYLGLAASATIAAVLNIFRPLNLLMQGAALLLLPGMSSLINKRAPVSVLAQNSYQAMVILVGGTFMYGLLATVFSGDIFHFLYAGKYDFHSGYEVLVFLVGLSYTASSFIQVCSSELKAAENVRAVISVWSVSALFVVCVIIPAMTWMGVNGAMAVVVISYLLAAVFAKKLVHSTRRTLEKGQDSRATLYQRESTMVLE